MASYIQFGHWSFDPDSCRLINEIMDCKLQPRIANLLEYLLNHPNEVHSHDRLIQEVWEGRIVSDDSVRQAVSTLRRVLAADGSDRFIKTICKKGYRADFPGPESQGASIELESNAASIEDLPSWDVCAARRGNHLVWATVLLLCIALGAWAMTSPQNHPHSRHGIASATPIAACGNRTRNSGCFD